MIFVWLKFVLIVTAYYSRSIFCTTITYFNWVVIEYFMEFVIFFENVYLIALRKFWRRLWRHFVVGRGKPNYLMFPFFVTCVAFVVFLTVGVFFYFFYKTLVYIACFVKCCLVIFFGVVKVFYWRRFSIINCLLSLANVLYLVSGLKKHLCNWDYYLAFYKLKVTLRQSASIRSVLISLLKHKFLNAWTMFFLSLFVCWPFKLLTTIKPCSLINPTSFWLISVVRSARINIPSSSHFCATLTPHSNIKARLEFLFSCFVIVE